MRSWGNHRHSFVFANVTALSRRGGRGEGARDSRRSRTADIPPFLRTRRTVSTYNWETVVEESQPAECNEQAKCESRGVAG